MPLDICVETYAAAVHMLDAIVGSGIFARRDDGATQPSATQPSATGSQRSDAAFHVTVRSATDGLPFAQAQAVWLVDVCGCDYAEAGQEMGVERETVISLVHDARSYLRNHLTT